RIVSGPWALQLSVEGCPSPDADTARETADDIGALPTFGTVSDLMAYAYALPPQAVVWPTGAADPDVQLIPAILRDRLPSPIVRHSECRAFLRRALAGEIGLAG